MYELHSAVNYGILTKSVRSRGNTMKHLIQLEALIMPGKRHDSYCATNGFWTLFASLRFV
jgi:hypothetical protein